MCYYMTGEVELCAEETPEYDDICPGAPGDEPPAIRRGAQSPQKSRAARDGGAPSLLAVRVEAPHRIALHYAAATASARPF